MGHYKDEHYGAYLGHLPFLGSKVHDILGAGDKNFPGTFWYLRIWPSNKFPLHHDLLSTALLYKFRLSFFLYQKLSFFILCRAVSRLGSSA